MMRLLCLLLFLVTGPAIAVQPDEILPDPALESRARAISQLIRCPVCQGENIDESNAPIARDLRLLVRERLVAGDSDEATVAYITDRYGEFVLFRPEARGANLILWVTGPVLLGAGLIGAGLYLRRRGSGREAAAADLTDDEKGRLAEILGK
jgi:cytochrome c-type biogenesis protein CcmH